MAKPKVRVRERADRDKQVGKFVIPKISNAEIPVDDLVPDARNSRKHTERQIALIAKSIQQYGFTNPLLVRRNKVIAGHARLEAAKRLGLKSVPVRVCDHLTDVQARALVIADNKLALVDFAWDDKILEEELRALHDEEFDLGSLGFLDDELPNFDDDAAGVSSNSPPTGMGNLSDRFLIPPFSVLNAREGWWQDRKRAWLALGIKSEVGRGENLMSMSEQNYEYMYDKKNYTSKNASPGGSPRPAMNYKNKERGDGAGKPLKKPSAIPGGGTGKNSGYMFKQEDGSYKALKDTQKGKAKAYNTTEWMKEKGMGGGCTTIADGSGTGTSIFDPVLCELAYLWFCPKGGTILDPFAGGSVRGIVASKLKRNYFGVDLRPEQIDANREQAKAICKGSKHVPKWVTGDSTKLPKLAKNVEADFVFSCPPYADLEVYSDDPADLSQMDYKEFREAYFDIIKKACAQLKQDRFACFVVGEVRHKKTGAYYNFVGDTVKAFQEAGLAFHNEGILVTAVGSLPIRVGKQFDGTRRWGKTHQNVLVFVKGDAKKAAKACGAVDVSFELVQSDTPESADE